MTDTYISGAKQTVGYAFESPDAFLEKAEEHPESYESYVAFGRGVDVSVSKNWNKTREYSIGSRNAEASVKKNFAGNISVNGDLSSPYWLLGILGSGEDGVDGNLYTHTYTESDRQPTITVKRTSDFGDTKGTETFVGWIINQGTLTASLNEKVKFSLEGPYRYETNPDVVTEPTLIFDEEEIFTFAGSTVSFGETAILGIENFEMTFVNSADMDFGLGSHYAEAVTSKQREYNFRYTAKIKDYSMLNRFLSSGELANLVLTFVNNAGDSLIITFGEVHINEDNLPSNPTETIKEDCTGWAHNCTSAIYTNTVEIAPTESSSS